MKNAAKRRAAFHLTDRYYLALFKASIASTEDALPIETEVSLKVYNLQGRQVISLVDQNMDAGYHSVVWNADNNASGMYFVQMRSGVFIKTQKLMLIK